MKEQVMDLLKLQVENVLAFDRVSHLLDGMAAVSWLPGENTTFDKKLRRPGDKTRPLCLVLESANDDLTLSIAVARPLNGKLHFTIHGRWDFRAPISPYGQRQQMNLNKPKHRLNCRRGVEMLSRMLDYGFESRRGNVVDIADPVWPRAFVSFPFGKEVIDNDKLDALAAQMAPAALADMCKEQLRQEYVDVSGPNVSVDVKIVPDHEIAQAIENGWLVEDFTPVLGVKDRNPAAAVKTVNVRVNNPAGKIIARHGIDTVDTVDAATFAALSTELTAAINAEFQRPVVLDEETICEALLQPSAPVPVTLSLEQALSEGLSHAVATAMRQSANGRAQKEAADSELITAARDATQPLVLNRLSAVQLNTVSAWQKLPPQYSGSIIPPIDWVPAHAIKTAVQPELVEM
jgi:hypothetical protein